MAIVTEGKVADVTADQRFNKIGRLLMESDQQKRDMLAMAQELESLRIEEAPKKKKAK